MRQTSDKFIIGAKEAKKGVPAINEKKDKKGNIITPAQEAMPPVEGEPGIEVNIKLPIPWEVIIAGLEVIDNTIHGMAKAGEIVARACAVGGLPKEIEEDGRKMLALCLQCSDYISAEDIKKNS